MTFKGKKIPLKGNFRSNIHKKIPDASRDIGDFL